MPPCSRPCHAPAASAAQHIARLYDDDDALAEHLADRVHTAAVQRQAVILIAVQSHIEAVRSRLEARACPVQSMIDSGQLILADAAACMDAVMCAGRPDRAAFDCLALELIDRGRRFNDVLFIYGEIVDLLWQQGDMHAADEIERWWNGLIAEHGFTLLCGYRAHALDERGQDVLESVCATHSHVVPAADNDRFERAVERGFRAVFPHADIALTQQQLAGQCPHPANMPTAQAAMIGLRRVLPALANLVRIESQKHLSRNAL